MDENDDMNNVKFSKIKQSLASNFYSILSPPPCQVEEQEPPDSNVTIERGKGSIMFCLPADNQSTNKITARWAQRIKNRTDAKANRTALHSSIATTYRLPPGIISSVTDTNSPRTYLHDDPELKRGVLNRTVPSAIVDSSATSSVGTPTDPFCTTGRASNKIFRLPNGATEAASEIGELATKVRAPAREVHITPGIAESSLISTSHFADAGYATIFSGDQVNIYDQNDTIITVSCSVRNNNTDTVIVNRPPSEFLSTRPPTEEAVNNVDELKMQPELVQYLHASTGFPTKPPWIKAVKNKQYAPWPGLTTEAVAKHFPKSEETIKGHARKTRSGLRSTKRTQEWTENLLTEHNADIAHTTTKSRDIFIQIYNVEDDEALLKIYTDQPGRFPKKSSRSNQYVMVMVELNSNAILVEAMWNCTSGKMIRA